MQSAVLLRDQSFDHVKNLCEAWWHEIQYGSVRDQVRGAGEEEEMNRAVAQHGSIVHERR
jgi:hypothetical protein